MTPFTTNLSEEELACHDGTPYPFDEVDDEDPQGRTWRDTRAILVAQLFEAIRSVCGDSAIKVDSAYRTLSYDQKLYDADKGQGHVATPQGSQHPKGKALDLVHSSMTPLTFFSAILAAFERGKESNAELADQTIYRLLGGIGLYPSFVHVDVRPRPSDHLAIWGGTRPSNIV